MMTPEEYAAKSAAKSRERKLRQRVDSNFTETREPDYSPPDEHLVEPLTPQGDILNSGPFLMKINPRTMSTVESDD